MSALDHGFIRAQFPAFEHPETKDWVMAENAGGSYAPTQVISTLHYFMTATKIQPYWPAAMSTRAGMLMDRAHARFAEALNVTPEEIHFGPSTSMNTYVLAQALRHRLNAGDEVIVTNQDHEANVGVWRRFADGNSGVIIREWTVDHATGQLSIEGLERLLTSRTQLVCVTQCSNIAGEVNDIPAIARLTRAAGAMLAVDAVSYTPHLLPDLSTLGADFYYFSLYKVFGPHQGLLYVRGDRLDRLSHQGHYFHESNSAKRLTPAGPQHGEIVCSNGILDYLEAVYAHHQFGAADAPLREQVAATMDAFQHHESALAHRILTFLREKGCRIIGPDTAKPHQRMATISFTSPKATPKAILDHLTTRQIAAGGGGHFYAKRLLQAVGLDAGVGVMRLSLVHYNTDEDVDRILTALDEIL